MKKPNIGSGGQLTRLQLVPTMSLIASCLVAVVLLSTMTASCGSDSGNSNPCTSVCAYAEDCWGDEGRQECLVSCPAHVQEVEQAGYDAQAVADCILEQASCMDLISDAALEALIWTCAETQNTTDGGTNPGPDAGLPPGHIPASEACAQIGHAFCNRRDDCLGEHQSDVAHCRNDVNQDCEGETGTVLESDIQSCASQIDDAACTTIFDESGNPIPLAGCPQY